MKEEKHNEDRLLKALRILSPGTVLREGLENVLRAKTGGLVVIGDSPAVMEIIDGGMAINCDLTPATLYELAKMDGAIILSHDCKKILYANTQLVPDPSIPSTETGIRHRTAERVARQTGAIVVAISQRRGIITLYQGIIRYVLRDLGVILTKANQALQTLEKYRKVLDQDLANLSALEFDDLVTVFEVAKVLQQAELVNRIVSEIRGYIVELGGEGRLVSMQLGELADDVGEEALLIIRDYLFEAADRDPEDIRQAMEVWAPDELMDMGAIGRILGYAAAGGNMDLSVLARGYRILNKIPRLPSQVVENLVQTFGDFQKILKASIEELDEVEGIGEVRARAIKNGLKRLREQSFVDRRV